jgi:hypothetical protein
MVCLKPGEDLTDEEIEALEEYFLLVLESRGPKRHPYDAT